MRREEWRRTHVRKPYRPSDVRERAKIRRARAALTLDHAAAAAIRRAA
jgi:hypothetical protein